jgi:nucleotide-binding universal stress UspA family protein
MFDEIVVPLDGSRYSEAAVHPAVTLARQTGARLVFVSCAPATSLEERTEYVRNIARGTFLPNAVDVVLDGPIADGIVAFADSHAPSLLCMTSHARGPMGQALFGHTVSDVIRSVNAPVLIVGPRGIDRANYDEVIIALDASDESARVVPAALALAKRLDAKVQLVQVVDPRDRAQAEVAGVPASDLSESGHVARLAKSLADDGNTFGWEVLHDDNPAAGIVAYAREHPNAIVAMSTHARSGLSLLAQGSVANEVVHASPCPVLLQY